MSSEATATMSLWRKPSIILPIVGLLAASGMVLSQSLAASADGGPTIDWISNSTPHDGDLVEVYLVDLKPDTEYWVAQCADTGVYPPPCSDSDGGGYNFVTGPDQTSETVEIRVYDVFYDAHHGDAPIWCETDNHDGDPCNITVVQHSYPYPHDVWEISIQVP